MYYETLKYVDGAGTTHEVALQNLSANGAPVSVKMYPRTHTWSEFHIILPQPPETTLDIPFRSQCEVWACRSSSTGAENSFSAGTRLFKGRRINGVRGAASAGSVATHIILGDALWDARHVTYQGTSRYISSGTTASPTYSTFNWPDVILFQAIPGASYSPAPLYGTISTWQQIQDIFNYLTGGTLGADALQLQLNSTAEFTPTYLNWYPVRSMKSLPVLQICLRPHPGIYTEIDYTTNPPTLHLRNRAHMTPVQLPYKSQLSDGTLHIATDIESLNELVPDRVALYYKITGTLNGNPVVNYSTDIYPVGAGPSLLSEEFSIDVTGAALQTTVCNFTAAAFDPTDKDLWRQRIPSLRQVSEGGQIPNDGAPAGALAFKDTAVNGGLTPHPEGIQVVDETGAAVDLGEFQYVTDMDVFGWMNDGAAAVKQATVIGYFSYAKNWKVGSASVPEKMEAHMHSLRLKLTNVPSGQYYCRQTVNTGEAIPSGLAQSIWTELQDLQWKLSHKVIQVASAANTVPTLIKPGRDKINLVGGLSAWESMNAVPESVEITFYRTGENRLVAEHSISCGPVDHLEPNFRVQLFNLFSNRNLRAIDMHQRLNGLSSSNQVDLTNEAARENTAPGQSLPQETNHIATFTP